MTENKIFGIHAAQSALDYSAKKIHHAWVDKQRQDKRLNRLTNELLDLGITVNKLSRKELDKLVEGNHQGIVIAIDMPSSRSENQLKQDLSSIQGMPFYLVLDQVQDPHNLGACLRTADAAGIHGIIIPKDNSTGITPTVCKVASGAAETIPVYQVTNLARTLRWLKEQQIWIVGSSGNAEQSIYQMDLNMPLALVVGTEGTGMRQLTEKHCDFLTKIPMPGQVESLNVSVATGVMVFEILRQRTMAT